MHSFSFRKIRRLNKEVYILHFNLFVLLYLLIFLPSYRAFFIALNAT